VTFFTHSGIDRRRLGSAVRSRRTGIFTGPCIPRQTTVFSDINTPLVNAGETLKTGRIRKTRAPFRPGLDHRTDISRRLICRLATALPRSPENTDSFPPLRTDHLGGTLGIFTARRRGQSLFNRVKGCRAACKKNKG
jgi:hypothetical protein